MSDVSLTFRLPETASSLRGDSPVLTSMHVPETTVDKNHFVKSGQDKIRFTGEVSSMGLEVVSHGAKELFYS